MTEKSSICSLAIVGDGSVGKSSIIEAFRSEGFIPVYKQTIGIDFYEKKLRIRGDIYASMRVWDIGGQSIHSKNLKQYLNPADVIFLVYDVTNYESFTNLYDWLENVKRYSKSNLIYVIGNKIDIHGMRQTNEIQHMKFISENGICGGMFMSAKTGENVVKTFYKVAGEGIGIKLTEYELAFHDKVVKASVIHSDNDLDGRTAFADDIEAEDRAAEARKNAGGCQCLVM